MVQRKTVVTLNVMVTISCLNAVQCDGHLSGDEYNRLKNFSHLKMKLLLIFIDGDSIKNEL